MFISALVGCGGGTGGATATESGGGTDDGSTSQATQTSQQTTTGEASESAGPTTSGGSQASQSGTTTDAPTEATGTETGDTTSQTTDQTTGGTTMQATISESGTTGDDTTSGTTTGDESTTGDAESSTGPGCVPSPEVCNDIDDDCDDQIDNVDVGKDGICDCLNIALLGNPGANPSAEFQGWLEAQGTEVDRISTNPAEVLDKAVLNKYDIIILDYLVRSYTAEEQAAVQTWVEAGGGMMSMTGFTAAQFVADRPNSLFKPMGLAYNTSKGFFSGPITNFAPHEITQDLTSISFYGGLYTDIVEDGVGVNKVIMTLPQGPVGVVQDRGAGRLFMFGDEWVEFDSEWKNIPQIKQFWVQTLSFLGPKESCQVPQ
jgi:hypothetical protein